jgi:hypothetical protein
VEIGSGHTEFAKVSVGDRFVFSDFNIAIGSINIENVHLVSVWFLFVLLAVMASTTRMVIQGTAQANR